MSDWNSLIKIDAHIHILPDDVHEANPDSEDVWVYADSHKYSQQMDALGIEKAVIMPLNDPWLMSMEFTVDAVHRNLAAMKAQYPGKFFAFADIDPRNSPDESLSSIRKAIEEYGVDGIKIHPNNSGIPADSEYYHPILAYAQAQHIPVAIHSYPNSQEDPGVAARVLQVLNRFPDLTAIVSHMGGHQWEQLLHTSTYVDISAILPDYVRSYGTEKTKTILHQFGANRLIFATDYPDSRILQPDEIYSTYFNILDQMDFTREEAEQIAYRNILQILTR